MKSVTAPAVLLALLLPALTTSAAPPAKPAAPPDAAEAETVAGLRDQLIAALRADIAALRRAKPVDAAGIERLSQTIETLAREPAAAEVRRAGGTFPASQTAGASWMAAIHVHGSEKSAALAARLSALQRSERTAEAAAQQQRAEALGKRAEALGKKAGPAALQAKTAADLDPLLAEIAEVTGSSGLGRSSGSDVAVFQQLSTLSQFITNWQNFLLLCETGRRPEALQALRNLSSSGREIPWVPRSELTRRLAEAGRLAGRLTAEESTAQVASLAEKALAAQTATEIDPLLATARKLQVQWQSEDGQAGYRMGAVVTFLERWQDFLMAQASGNAAKLRETATQLLGNEARQLELPRSKVLERIYAIGGAAAESDTTPGSARGKTAGPAKIEKPETVVARIRKLEDLAGNLEALQAAATLESGRSYLSGPWQAAIQELSNIQREYLQWKNGQAVRVTLGISNLPHATDALASALRQELAVLAIQRLIGDEARLAPEPGENVLTYQRRLLAAARERQDWRLVQRILDAGQTAGVPDPHWKTSDSAALATYLTGVTQERAKQIAFAVVSYQSALKSGSALLPVDDIAVRLARLKKEHPSDYEQGVLWSVAPPSAYPPRPVGTSSGSSRFPEKAVVAPETRKAPEAPVETVKPAETKPEEASPTKP